MIYQLRHRTEYHYESTATLSQNVVCLEPRATPYQTCRSFTLRVDPPPTGLETSTDYFGNRFATFAVQRAHRRLTIEARSEVEVRPHDAPDPAFTPSWEDIQSRLRIPATAEDLAASQFRFDSAMVTANDAVRAYAAPSFGPGRPALSAALDYMGRIKADHIYDPKATTVHSSVDEVLTGKRGVCQDFAHLLIAGMRSMGLAARYVSGYLETLPPPGRPKLIGADASHAWVSIYIPDWGWIDLDPTNNVVPNERHITVAWGRDYRDITPVRGVVIGGGAHSLSVAVDVEPQV
ncbi:MAG: transglutaminase family protein [Deltaproteobacteria bacterium]|nr:transglutaminase family protein [Deltaproteobacteria bacterium]